MKKADDQIAKIADEIVSFSRSRGWDELHSPQNLAISIAIESSELLELFQWTSGNEADDNTKELAESEVADILIYLIQFCQLCGIDLIQAVQKKLITNASRFPKLSETTFQER